MTINRLTRGVVRLIWTAAILMLVLLAVYVSVGRILLPNLPSFQEQIEAYLSDRLQRSFEVERIAGDWQGLQPSIAVKNLRVISAAGEADLTISSLNMRLDVMQSIMQRKAIFSSLVIAGGELVMVRDARGGWRPALARESDSLSGALNRLMLLLQQQHIELHQSLITFVFSNGQRQSIDIARSRLDTLDGFAAVSGELFFASGRDQGLKFQANLTRHEESGALGLQAYFDADPLQLENWQPLIAELLPFSVNIRQAHLGAEVWLDWHSGQSIDVRGSLIAPVLEFASAEVEIEPVVEVRTDFIWQRQANNPGDWTLWLDDFSFRWHNEIFNPTQQRWAWSARQEHPVLSLTAKAIDLELTANTLLAIEQVPDSLQEVLTVLRPQGRLYNANLSYTFRPDNALGEFNLEAEFDSLKANAWRGSPAVENLDGYLFATLKGGEVAFSGDDTFLHFSKLYDEGWQFSRVSGAVKWQRGEHGVWLDSDLIRLQGEMGEAVGRFTLALPTDGTENRIDLLIGLGRAPVRTALALVPDQRLNQRFVSWLRGAVQGGEVNQGRFVYSGTATRSDAVNENNLDLIIDAQDMQLAYHPDWPSIERAQVKIKAGNRKAQVRIDRASLMDITLEDTLARWEAGNEQLSVRTKIQGDMQQGLKLLRETPLRKVLFDLVDEMDGNGGISGDLNLAVPLNEASAVEVALNIRAEDAGLVIKPWKLNFEQINGGLSYSSQAGIQARQIQARFLNQPVSIDIETEPAALIASLEEKEAAHDATGAEPRKQKTPSQAPPKALRTTLRMQGRTAMKDLFAWLPNPLAPHLSGTTDYLAELRVGAGADSLSISSGLQGIEIEIPAPYAKAAELARPLHFSMALEGEPIHYLDYADLFHYALLFDSRGYHSGEVRLGPGEAVYDGTPGIAVRGSIARLELDSWTAFFKGLLRPPDLDKAARNEEAAPAKSLQGFDWWLAKVQNSAPLAVINAIEIQSELILGSDFELPEVILQAEQIESGWWLQLDSPNLKGRVNLYANQNKPVLIELEHLRLPKSEKGGDALAQIDPRWLPAAEVAVKEFILGQSDLGSWMFKLRPLSRGVTAEELVIDIANMQVAGELSWQHINGSSVSSASGFAHTQDIGATASAWGYPDMIEGKTAEFRGEFSWQGSPAAFSMRGISGDLNVNIGEGRFVDLETTPRIFGLFNFSSIARRVRLDFSDMFKKGFSFDRAQGDLDFQTGIVHTSSPLIIDGPSAKFKIEGTTDLLAEEVDQEVVVVLPLSDIPIAAAIVSAPELGIPLWLINKAFGNMFERFTSARYTFKGPWDDPHVELVKIFENRNSGAGENKNEAKPQTETEEKPQSAPRSSPAPADSATASNAPQSAGQD